MAEKSMKDCLLENDLDTAFARYQSTSPRWRGKWYEVCEEIFSKCADFAQKYVINPLMRTISKIVEVKQKATAKTKIMVDDGIELLEKGGEQLCYLFEFYNDKNELVCSKVGTTTRTIKKRLQEELKSKTYAEMGVVRGVIKRIYNCGQIPAEGLESYFRAKYIQAYPSSFKKNDRFMNQYFDLKKADAIAEEYLRGSVVFLYPQN